MNEVTLKPTKVFENKGVVQQRVRDHEVHYTRQEILTFEKQKILVWQQYWPGRIDVDPFNTVIPGYVIEGPYVKVGKSPHQLLLSLEEVVKRSKGEDVLIETNMGGDPIEYCGINHIYVHEQPAIIKFLKEQGYKGNFFSFHGSNIKPRSTRHQPKILEPSMGLPQDYSRPW